MVVAHDEKKEEGASEISGVSSDLGIGQSLDPDIDALTPEIKASDSEDISTDPKAVGIQKPPVSLAGVVDAGGSAADKTALHSVAKSTPIDADLNPDFEANTNRSVGTRITNTIGNIGGVGLAAGGIGGAAALGTTIAAAAGDSKANELVGSAFGAGVDGISAGYDALKVGSWANTDAWNGNHDWSQAHNYSTAEKLGSGANVGGGLTTAMGGISVITGSVDWHYGKVREKAAKKAGDTAGVTLGNETKWSGRQSVATGIAGIGSGAAKLAAVAHGSAAALGVAGGLGAVGSVVSLYQGGKMFFGELIRKWKNRKFSPLTRIGEKWNNFVKSKKNKRIGLSALKMVGAGLGIAAAIMGTVAGAGLPLLIAGGLIAGGMGIAKLSRSISNNKKISAAKAKMRADGKYNEEYTSEKNKKKWYNPSRLLNKSNKTVESDKSKIPDENKIKKGSAEELEEIKQTQLAQKRAKPGNKDAESKFSVARGIKDKLKSANGISFIHNIVEKVDKWLDPVAFEKKAQEKAAAAAKAVEKQAAASKKSYFWSNWGKKTTSPAPVPAVTESIAPNTTEQPAIAAPMVPLPSDVAEPAAAEDSATAKPAEGNSAEDKSPSEPSPNDKEVFDAFHVSQKIGVTPEEVLSGSGEELIEKRLSVTNSL